MSPTTLTFLKSAVEFHTTQNTSHPHLSHIFSCYSRKYPSSLGVCVCALSLFHSLTALDSAFSLSFHLGIARPGHSNPATTRNKRPETFLRHRPVRKTQSKLKLLTADYKIASQSPAALTSLERTPLPLVWPSTVTHSRPARSRSSANWAGPPQVHCDAPSTTVLPPNPHRHSGKR